MEEARTPVFKCEYAKLKQTVVNLPEKVKNMSQLAFFGRRDHLTNL
jgi:hypothetical protein